MRINGNHTQSIPAPSAARPLPCAAPSGDAPMVNDSTGGGRALVPLFPAQSGGRERAAVRQPAVFLAHLIATRQALPQTRERRRIEPSLAATIYSAAHAPAPARSGRTLLRQT
jgi:hypothetical protein